MKNNIAHRRSLERVAAISLPSDGVAADHPALSSFRWASGGRVLMRRVPFMYGGKESGAFVWSSMIQRYHDFFYGLVTRPCQKSAPLYCGDI